MPTCSLPGPSTPARLAEIAAVVEAAHHTAVDAGPSLVRVRGLADADIELALAPVPSGDVLDHLLGTTTPPEWEAAGVVVDGTARDVDAADGRVGPRMGSVRVAVLCGRDGATASVLRRDGEEPVHTSSRPGEPGPIGRVADALRRTLALPTAAPSTPVAVAVVHVWLHRVLTFVLRGDPVDVALAESLRPPAPTTWTSLREQCAEGGWVELECPAHLATWMDDGMFSRWCVAGFAEPLEVLVELSELVDPRVAEHLGRALATAVGAGRPRRTTGSVRP